VATKNTTISNNDNCQLTTLVNSASTAPLIGLPQKDAEFCHTSNILLVGHQRRHALLWLYFNSSAGGWGSSAGWSLVGWYTIGVSGLLGGFPPKG
jgi:hypothetical protein